MPLYNVRCNKCRTVTEDVIVKFVGSTVIDDKGNEVKSMKEESDFVCPNCGGKRYKRLPAKIQGIKIL